MHIVVNLPIFAIFLILNSNLPMKKLIAILFITLATLSAKAFYVGGLDYYAYMSNDNICTVRGFDPNYKLPSEMTLVIPDYVKAPDGETYKVISIAQEAFKGYPEIKKLVLGSNLEEIGSRAFASCINIEEANIFPATQSIGQEAFYGCLSLKSLTTSAEIIGAGAFEGCVSLSLVNLGAPMKYIEPGAFKGCTLLTNIDIPWTVVQIGNGIGYVRSDGVFENCLALLSVTFSYNLSDKIPSVRRIGTDTFKNCISLSRLDFPYSVEEILQGAFANCAELKHIEFGGPNRLNLYMNDFEGIPLKRLVCHGNLSVTGDYLRNLPELKEVRFDTYATTIPSRLFQKCTALKEVHLGDVEKIDDYAFEGCTALAEIDLSRVKTFSYNAFEGCTSIEHVDLSAAEQLGGNCFRDCTSLKSAIIGGNLQRLGNNFANTSITSLSIPDNVTYVDIRNMPLLKHVEIGNGVTRLPKLYECDALTSIKVGNSVTSADVDSPNLTSLTIGNPTPPYGTISYHLYEQCRLIVPENSLEAYKATIPWSRFFAIEESPYASQGVNPGMSQIERPQTVSRSALKVSVCDGIVKIQSNSPTDIYNLNGQKIKNLKGGMHNVALPGGTYIVISGGECVKVVVAAAQG